MTDKPSWRVERLGERGDGMIALAGHLSEPEYVPGAVPGDIVRRREGGGYDIEPTPVSQRRAEPLCPHYPACGGCTVQHLADDLYRAWKATKLFSALASHGVVELDVDDDVIAPMVRVPAASRRRAVLTARREAAGMKLGFHEHQSHVLVDIAACAVLRPAIVAALPALREMAARLVRPGESARLTVLDTGSGLDVAIDTGRRPSRGAKAPGAPGSADRAALVRLAGSARIVRITADGEPLVQRARPLLEVAGAMVEPPPGAFVQAAAEAEAEMVRLATSTMARGRVRRVADLFAGLGAFTFALACHARVLAIDADRPMLEALAAGARGASGLKPIETRVRDLFRDPLSPRELDTFDAVVVDPPRAGAKAQSEALARSKVPLVVAVSCNPATLARDVAILIEGGYRLESATPIDQFLFTGHLEAVAVLRRGHAKTK